MKVPTSFQAALKMMAFLFAISVCQMFHQPQAQFSKLSNLSMLGKSVDWVNDRSEEISLKEFSFERMEMAMPIRVTVWAESETEAVRVCKKAFKRVVNLVAVFSDYDDSSEINRLLRSPVGSPVKVSSELIEVLAFSQSLSRNSHRAFDPTIGPIIQLWRDSRKSQILPDSNAIESAKQKTGFEHFLIDRDRSEVTVLIDSLKLDFGGVAKGYIGDEVIKLLRNEGVSIAKFRAGGDIVLGDSPPNSEGWPIELEQCQQQKSFYLNNCGVSTSGDRYQFVEIDGRRYSHVVDPATGVGVTTGRTAFVIAPSGMQSDALATAGCVMKSAEFQDFLKTENSKGWVEAASFR